MSGPSWRVGIDENGLGPKLGPLVVTAVLARTEGDGEKRAESRPRGKLAERLGDSKKLVSFGDTALGEAWARALAERMGIQAETPDALIHALALDPAGELRRLCPDGHVEQCWSARDEVFEATPELLDGARKDLAKLDKLGVIVETVAFAIVCTARLNDAAARGVTRFHVDLHAMERLAVQARARAKDDLFVTCGKVGGFNQYSPHFGPLSGRLHTMLEEGRARSEYYFPGFGRMAFVRDADAKHLLVCMASLVGKWARDLLMGRIVRHYRAMDPGLPVVSGYSDPITQRFIAATALTRKARGVQDRCFERNAVGSQGDGGDPPPTSSEERESEAQPATP